MRARRDVVRAGNRARAKATGQTHARPPIRVSSMLLCSSCGWLNAHDVEACARCRSASFMQPAAAGVMELLAAQESDERLARLSTLRRWVGRVGWAGTVAVAALGCATLVASLAFGTGKGEPVFPVLALMVTVMFGIPAGLGMARGLGRYWKRTEAFSRPSRWRFAEPRGPETSEVRGELLCAQPLIAPLTGRPCAGFELGIRSDDDVGGAPGTWLLLEQRMASCSVGGQPVAPDGVHLEAERTAVIVSAADTRMKDALQDRGFSSTVPGRRVFETIIPVGASVSLAKTRGADVLRIA